MKKYLLFILLLFAGCKQANTTQEIKPNEFEIIVYNYASVVYEGKAYVNSNSIISFDNSVKAYYNQDNHTGYFTISSFKNYSTKQWLEDYKGFTACKCDSWKDEKGNINSLGYKSENYAEFLAMNPQGQTAYIQIYIKNALLI